MQKLVGYLLFCFGVVIGVMTTVPLYIHFATQDYIFESVIEAPTSTAAMVLGASVVRGEPSPVLQRRAEVALALYQAGKVRKILVTGDDSVPGFDEVSPVRRFLEAADVAEEDIFLDHAGFDTYSSMYRAREVFGVTDVLVVSQAFHLPRAVYIARKLGLQAHGVVAPQESRGLYSRLREVPASLKAMRDLAGGRLPRFLGPQFPIEGDGTATWQ